jgi:large subunit ribosomal protein L34e
MRKYKKKRTPGNRNLVRPVLKKTSSLRCGLCGAPIHGVKRMTAAKMAGSSAAQKRVSRVFGGSICSQCCREAIRQKARKV